MRFESQRDDMCLTLAHAVAPQLEVVLLTLTWD